MEHAELKEDTSIANTLWGKWFNYDTSSKLKLPLFAGRISSGFPLPANDYRKNRIDQNKPLFAWFDSGISFRFKPHIVFKTSIYTLLY
jgi:hypothetical protein